MCKDDEMNEKRSTKLIEPRCMEFVSALAAGKRARLIVEVTAEGITPLTIALAAAAKQTGGRLVCIVLLQKRRRVNNNKVLDDRTTRARLMGNDHPKDVVELVECCGKPREFIDKYTSVDFAVIDCKLEDHLKLYKILNLNPSGSTVVANKLRPRVLGERLVNPFVGVLRAGKQGVVPSHVVFPVGSEGIEINTFGSINKYNNINHQQMSRRFKRFHVTFEN